MQVANLPINVAIRGQVIVQGLESLGLAQIWEGHSHFESVECRFETLSEQMIWIGGVGGVERAYIHGSDI